MRYLDDLILNIICMDWMPSDIYKWEVNQYWNLKNSY